MSRSALEFSRRAFLARIQSASIGGEQFYRAKVLFTGLPSGRPKAVFKIDERPTEHLVRADLADWAWRLGKQLRIES